VKASERPAASASPLIETHDSLLLDLDGVVHLGDTPIAPATAAIARARAAGRRVVFVTNNASRPPADVVDTLRGFGVEAQPGEVITSAAVAATMLAQRLGAGAPVLVVGSDGLRHLVETAGLTVVRSADAQPEAVVQGWGPAVDWAQLAEASIALRAGALWVATNLDRTLPSPRGPLPGNGSLVEALRAATGLDPALVVGKPHPALFTAAAEIGGASPLFVGDRLDTDIAGATAAGLDALLVLSGVTTALDLLAARDEGRPSWIGRDLSAIFRPQPAVFLEGNAASCGGVVVHADGSVDRVPANRSDGPAASDGRTASDGLDGLRAACVLAWAGQLEPASYEVSVKNLDLD
jgi:glycerol-1-phosphatase